MKSSRFTRKSIALRLLICAGLSTACGKTMEPSGDTESSSDSVGNADGGTDGDTDGDGDGDADGGVVDTDSESVPGSDEGTDGAQQDTGPDDCYYDGERFDAQTASRDVEGEGSCRLEVDGYYATVSNALFADAAACGRCLHVMNPETGVSVDVVAVDRCPDGSDEWCGKDGDDVAVSPDAFAALGGTEDPLHTKWYYIPCEGDGDGKIQFRFEGGSNPYWFAVQVKKHRNPLKSVEVLCNDTWTEAVLQTYNFWVIESGCGEGPFDIRVTDIFDNTLFDHDIPFTLNTDLPGASQFPACSGDEDTDTPTDSDSSEDVTITPEPGDCNYDGALYDATSHSFEVVNDGACRLEAGQYQVTVPDTLYQNAAACGACVRVVNRQTGTSVDAVVRERCPAGSEDWCPSDGHDIALNAEAFDALGGNVGQALRTAWYYIPCTGDGYDKIQYRFEGGANPYWFAVQIRNHRNPVQSVAVECEGTWTDAVRQDYNYWVIESGCGEGPFALRVTDIYGNSLTDQDIPLTVNENLPGNAQFPACAP